MLHVSELDDAEFVSQDLLAQAPGVSAGRVTLEQGVNFFAENYNGTNLNKSNIILFCFVVVQNCFLPEESSANYNGVRFLKRGNLSNQFRTNFLLQTAIFLLPFFKIILPPGPA